MVQQHTRSSPTKNPKSSLVQSTISDEDLQRALTTAGFYKSGIDGMFGIKTVAAMDAFLQKHAPRSSFPLMNWPIGRRKILLGQLLCKERNIEVGPADGLYGPLTQSAFEDYNRLLAGQPADVWRDTISPDGVSQTTSPPDIWPVQKDVPGVFGNHCAAPLKRLELPFSMKIAWDLDKEITGFMVHEKVHDSAARVFDKIWQHYGQAGIQDIGVDLFGGCYNCRKMKGGTSWSMHSWAIAIDFDPARNQLKWSRLHARLAKPDAVKFWEFWEEEGWLSLGRARDFDWMHVQAARL